MADESTYPVKPHVRDRRFSRDPLEHRHWMAGDPVGTAFYNALSAGFPDVERFFVEAIRAYRDLASPKLAAEIDGMCAQEMMHTREHVVFNRRMGGAGYDLSSIENAIAGRLKKIRAMPPIVSLTATMALEHYTAILAHEALSNPRHFRDAEPEAAELWRWHASEEIEHKGVAYDAWLLATRDWGRFRRWKLKSKVMMLATRNLLVDRIGGAIELLRQDGHTGLGTKIRLLWFLFGWPGLFRNVFLAWASFFMPGFHPWNHDNSYLLAKQGREPAGTPAHA